MTGTEQALQNIARDLWDSAAEDRAHLADIWMGRIPANDLYTVKLIDEIHRIQCKADTMRLERLKLDWQAGK